MEYTEVKVVTPEQEQEIYKKFPRFERLCRKTTEERLEASNEMFTLFMSSTPEERYVHLLNTRPGLLNRVPQYHLASYLDVKPESLSRIRKRLAGK